MLGVTDPVLALDLDIAAAGCLMLGIGGEQREVVFGEPADTRAVKTRLDQI